VSVTGIDVECHDSMKHIIFAFFLLSQISLTFASESCESSDIGSELSKIIEPKAGGLRCKGDDWVNYGNAKYGMRRGCVKKRTELFGKPACSGNRVETYDAWCVAADGSKYNHSEISIRYRKTGVSCNYQNCDDDSKEFHLKE
jgi:hypothetical protein